MRETITNLQQLVALFNSIHHYELNNQPSQNPQIKNNIDIQQKGDGSIAVLYQIIDTRRRHTPKWSFQILGDRVMFNNPPSGLPIELDNNQIAWLYNETIKLLDPARIAEYGITSHIEYNTTPHTTETPFTEGNKLTSGESNLNISVTPTGELSLKCKTTAEKNKLKLELQTQLGSNALDMIDSPKDSATLLVCPSLGSCHKDRQQAGGVYTSQTRGRDDTKLALNLGSNEARDAFLTIVGLSELRSGDQLLHGDSQVATVYHTGNHNQTIYFDTNFLSPDPGSEQTLSLHSNNLHITPEEFFHYISQNNIPLIESCLKHNPELKFATDSRGKTMQDAIMEITDEQVKTRLIDKFVPPPAPPPASPPIQSTHAEHPISDIQHVAIIANQKVQEARQYGIKTLELHFDNDKIHQLNLDKEKALTFSLEAQENGSHMMAYSYYGQIHGRIPEKDIESFITTFAQTLEAEIASRRASSTRPLAICDRPQAIPLPAYSITQHGGMMNGISEREGTIPRGIPQTDATKPFPSSAIPLHGETFEEFEKHISSKLQEYLGGSCKVSAKQKENSTIEVTTSPDKNVSWCSKTSFPWDTIRNRMEALNSGTSEVQCTIGKGVPGAHTQTFTLHNVNNQESLDHAITEATKQSKRTCGFSK